MTTLLPALQAIADAVASPSSSPASPSIPEARAAAHAMLDSTLAVLGGEAPPAVADEVDHQVAVDGAEITVRLYRPAGERLPVHVYIHGGGFWTGTLDHSDAACRRIVHDVGCAVVSVAHRLAPECPFPGPAEDCYAALGWVAEHAEGLGLDPDRLSIGGVSSGGNLAAAVTLMARDRGGPAIAFQVLEIPVTDLTMSQPSIEENAAGPLLTRAGVAWFIDGYLADPADATHPYASPLLAPDVAGLPPALVMTAELDPLRDEGEAYARRLAAAGVAVEHHRWDGQFHGSQSMAALIPEEAATYRAHIAAALSAALEERP